MSWSQDGYEDVDDMSEVDDMPEVGTCVRACEDGAPHYGLGDFGDVVASFHDGFAVRWREKNLKTKHLAEDWHNGIKPLDDDDERFGDDAIERTPMEIRTKPEGYICTVLAIIASFGAYFTLIAQLSDVASANMRPCNDDTCIFIRYMGGGGLPASAPAYITCDINSSSSVLVNSSDVNTYCNHSDNGIDASAVPAFIKIKNGDPVIEFAKHGTGNGNWLTVRAWHYMWGDKYNRSYATPARQNQTEKQIQKFCTTQHAQKGIKNHLTTAPSKKIYLTFLIIVAICLMLHDTMLLCGADDGLTLAVAQVMVLFWILATASAFLWSLGAAQVFVSENDAPGPHGCYYQMDTIELLIVIATPALMIMKTWDYLWLVSFTMLHGHMLLSKSFFVPMRVVASSFGRDATTSNFVGLDITGDSHRRGALEIYRPRYGQVVCQGLMKMLQGLITASIVVSFAAPALIGRLMVVAEQGICEIFLWRRSVFSFSQSHTWFIVEVVVAITMLVISTCGTLYVLVKAFYSIGSWSLKILVIWKQWREPPAEINRSQKAPHLGTIYGALIQIVLTIYSVFFVCIRNHNLLKPWFWHTTVTPNQVQEWGLAGYALVSLFVLTYAPMDTPWAVLFAALRMKYQPPDKWGSGLRYILYLNKSYPQLGLTTEAWMVVKFLDEHKESADRMKDTLLCATIDDFYAWRNFRESFNRKYKNLEKLIPAEVEKQLGDEYPEFEFSPMKKLCEVFTQ